MLFLACLAFVVTIRFILWKINNLPAWVVFTFIGMLILWPHLPDFVQSFLGFIIGGAIGAAIVGLPIRFFLGIPIWVTVVGAFVIAACEKAAPVVTSVWTFINSGHMLRHIGVGLACFAVLWTLGFIYGKHQDVKKSVQHGSTPLLPPPLVRLPPRRPESMSEDRDDD